MPCPIFRIPIQRQDVMRYHRSYQPGGSYFFTLVTYRRQPLLSIPENINRLRTAFKRETEKHPFTIDAIVILPDHLHTLWILPEGDHDYSSRWSRIKRYFSIGSVEPIRCNRHPAPGSGKSRSGSGASGNTSSAMTMIGGDTWITSITTWSNMAMSVCRVNGRVAPLPDA